MARVSVDVCDFKFNAAHFVCFAGFRERLHGHNYRVGVKLAGPAGSVRRNGDGYLLDFGDVKACVRRLCKETLNERFLLPAAVDPAVMSVTDDGPSCCLKCHHDGAVFVIPKHDCAVLPITHSTVEALGEYVWGVVVNDLGREVLQARGIDFVEIRVSEETGQLATWGRSLLDGDDEGAAPPTPPKPCL